MKCQVFLNRITIPYKEDFNKAQKYFAEHGVNIQFVFKNSDIRGYKSVERNTHVGGRQYVLNEVKIPLNKSFDINIFAFDIMEWKSPAGSRFPLLPTTPSGSCMMVKNKPFIMLPISPFEKETWITICHELMHSLNKIYDCKDVMDSYRLNSEPNNPNSNFIEQWSLLEPYLKKEVDLTSFPKSMYKYFQPNEIIGLKSELIEKLDEAREKAGCAFVITSGFRTEEQNRKVGGREDSAHLTGEAVDLKCTDSDKRYRILKALILEGFNRIGIADNFIHCDISKTLPQDVIWYY